MLLTHVLLGEVSADTPLLRPVRHERRLERGLCAASACTAVTRVRSSSLTVRTATAQSRDQLVQPLWRDGEQASLDPIGPLRGRERSEGRSVQRGLDELVLSRSVDRSGTTAGVRRREDSPSGQVRVVTGRCTRWQWRRSGRRRREVRSHPRRRGSCLKFLSSVWLWTLHRGCYPDARHATHPWTARSPARLHVFSSPGTCRSPWTAPPQLDPRVQAAAMTHQSDSLRPRDGAGHDVGP